jgi:hypothetical protein
MRHVHTYITNDQRYRDILVCSFILWFSEILVPTFHSTPCHSTGGSHMHIYCHENLRLATEQISQDGLAEIFINYILRLKSIVFHRTKYTVYCFTVHLVRLWSPPSLLYSGHRWLFSREGGGGRNAEAYRRPLFSA